MRRGTLRLSHEIARGIRAGHPWVYREACVREMRERAGDPIELVDWDGEFVGRGIYDGESAIAVRVMTRDPRDAIGPELVARRVREAIELRRACVDFDREEAVRVVHAESDGLPAITVDRYGPYAVAHFYCPAAWRYREAVYDELERQLSVKAIYEQRRFKSLGGDAPRGPAELMRGAAAPVDFEVREGELKFWVDVTAPLSTGLFLDLRLGRQAVARWARDRRVLNLFSYTGAISVYAAHGGAREVVAVDVAAKAHARARRNFALNGFDSEAPEHIVADAFKALARMVERSRQFDMVVVDPPAFASGARGKVFSAIKDYSELVAGALSVLAPGGVLVAVCSTRKLSLADFENALGQGALEARAELRIVERPGLPPDFPQVPTFAQASYLKCVVALANKRAS